jgi:hypothetical protein
MTDDQKVQVFIPPGDAAESPLPPGYVWTGNGYLNCSPAANAARLAQIDSLRTQLYGGVAAVGDRGRSVTYRNNADIVNAISALQGELAYCTTGAWPSSGGIKHFTFGQAKNL